MLTITGAGFAGVGPLNKVLVGGVACIPRVVRNHACKASEADNGHDCVNARARSTDPWSLRDNAHWIDFSVRRCKLDPSLKAPWFQNLNLRVRALLSS